MTTNTITATTVEVGMGCGTGSDGSACSPAYLCPLCIELLNNYAHEPRTADQPKAAVTFQFLDEDPRNVIVALWHGRSRGLDDIDTIQRVLDIRYGHGHSVQLIAARIREGQK